MNMNYNTPHMHEYPPPDQMPIHIHNLPHNSLPSVAAFGNPDENSQEDPFPEEETLTRYFSGDTPNTGEYRSLDQIAEQFPNLSIIYPLSAARFRNPFGNSRVNLSPGEETLTKYFSGDTAEDRSLDQIAKKFLSLSNNYPLSAARFGNPVGCSQVDEFPEDETLTRCFSGDTPKTGKYRTLNQIVRQISNLSISNPPSTAQFGNPVLNFQVDQFPEREMPTMYFSRGTPNLGKYRSLDQITRQIHNLSVNKLLSAERLGNLVGNSQGDQFPDREMLPRYFSVDIPNTGTDPSLGQIAKQFRDLSINYPLSAAHFGNPQVNQFSGEETLTRCFSGDTLNSGEYRTLDQIAKQTRNMSANSPLSAAASGSSVENSRVYVFPKEEVSTRYFSRDTSYMDEYQSPNQLARHIQKPSINNPRSAAVFGNPIEKSQVHYFFKEKMPIRYFSRDTPYTDEYLPLDQTARYVIRSIPCVSINSPPLAAAVETLIKNSQRNQFFEKEMSAKYFSLNNVQIQLLEKKVQGQKLINKDKVEMLYQEQPAVWNRNYGQRENYFSKTAPLDPRHQNETRKKEPLQSLLNLDQYKMVNRKQAPFSNGDGEDYLGQTTSYDPCRQSRTHLIHTGHQMPRCNPSTNEGVPGRSPVHSQPLYNNSGRSAVPKLGLKFQTPQQGKSLTNENGNVRTPVVSHSRNNIHARNSGKESYLQLETQNGVPGVKEKVLGRYKPKDGKNPMTEGEIHNLRRIATAQRHAIHEHIRSYTERINHAHQEIRVNGIRILNVAEDDSEDPMQVVVGLFKQLDLDVNFADIECCHKKSSGRGATTFIVRFFSSRIKTKVISRNRRVFGTKIRIEEELSHDRAKLLKLASSVFGRKNARIRNRRIAVVLPDGNVKNFSSVSEFNEFLRASEFRLPGIDGRH